VQCQEVTPRRCCGPYRVGVAPASSSSWSLLKVLRQTVANISASRRVCTDLRSFLTATWQCGWVSTGSAPDAVNITVAEVLGLLDGKFASLAEGVATGLYSFWLGSGISLARVEGLNGVVVRVVEFLRARIDPNVEHCPYAAALEEVLRVAGVPQGMRAGIDVAVPFDQWPSRNDVVEMMARHYSRVLDVRVGDERGDFLLWEAVDPVSTYGTVSEPDIEHLCVGILALEGVVRDIPTANWDGLIEEAVTKLAGSAVPTLQVCVVAADFLGPAGRARLLKFHGCAVRAKLDPATYRDRLIAALSQLTDWPHSTDPDIAVMRGELVSLATTRRTLMVGLSAADGNIQAVFAKAKAAMPWTWPSDPPPYLFAEDRLGADQENILKNVYRDQYDGHALEIREASELRAYGKSLLLGLVLHVVCDKARAVVELVDAPGLQAQDRHDLAVGLAVIRDKISHTFNSGDRLAATLEMIEEHGRFSAAFSEGRETLAGDLLYRPFTAVARHQLLHDPMLARSGVRELAAALALLGRGEQAAQWTLAGRRATAGAGGDAVVRSSAGDSTVYFFANAQAALRMRSQGVLDPDDKTAVVIFSGGRPEPLTRSPRKVRRTGRARAREVSMTELLGDSTDLADLEQRFAEAGVL
jgi:hypothetical protein